MLPVLLACVLPSAGRPAGLLRPHLGELFGTAHELRHRWLLEALPVRARGKGGAGAEFWGGKVVHGVRGPARLPPFSPCPGPTCFCPSPAGSPWLRRTTRPV